MWKACQHLWHSALWLWSAESWTLTWNTALQLGLCTIYLSMQCCWAPNIPMVIRPTSGMRVKGKKKRCKHVPVHALKAYCGSRGIATAILNLDPRWRWVVKFMPQPLYPRGKNPGARWIGGWVGPIAGLNVWEKRRIFCLWRDSNPGSSSPIS